MKKNTLRNAPKSINFDDSLKNDQKDDLNPLTVKKRKSKPLSDAYRRIGSLGKADRVNDCATYVELRRDVESGERRLHRANFCRVRLCPVCAWLRTRQVWRDVSDVMNAVDATGEAYKPIFLTLTIKNCSGVALQDTLDRMFGAFNRFWVNIEKKGFVLGWFRALEITYNHQTEEYHPHFHLILLMKPDFWKRENYITTEKWVKHWRKSLRIDYDPVCYVEKIKSNFKSKNKNKKSNVISEIAKYTIKDSDYLIPDNEELTDKLVKVFDSALHRRRLIAFGGLMKILHKKIKENENKTGEIIDENGVILRPEIDYIIEFFEWNIGASKYKKRNGL